MNNEANEENKEVLSRKERREKIKELVVIRGYGETLSYEELNEILQENLNDYYGKTVFRRQMNRIKNELFELGYVIRPIYGKGYYVLKPKQISSYTYRNYMVKPLNSFKKARTILENTEKKKLKGQETTEYLTTCELNEAMIYANATLISSDEYKILNNKEK